MRRGRRPGARWVGIIGIFVLLVSCKTRLAPPEVQVNETNELSDALASEGLDDMLSHLAHLRAVSDPLRLHGASLCADENVPYLGLTVLVVPQGRRPPPFARAMRLRGIEANPTVVTVMEGSPAAKAGLQRNDVIRYFNGRRVIRYQNFLEALTDGSRRGPRLEIERAGEIEEVVLPYTPACTPPASFSFTGYLLTWRSGGRVTVARGLMDFVRNDDELAILISHEMAHQILDLDDARPTADTEAQADRLSLELARRAGYDIRAGVEIWERIAVEHPELITTHPQQERQGQRFYHGHIAARTLLMPELIAETGSKEFRIRDED